MAAHTATATTDIHILMLAECHVRILRFLSCFNSYLFTGICFNLSLGAWPVNILLQIPLSPFGMGEKTEYRFFPFTGCQCALRPGPCSCCVLRRTFHTYCRCRCDHPPGDDHPGWPSQSLDPSHRQTGHPSQASGVHPPSDHRYPEAIMPCLTSSRFGSARCSAGVT